MNKKNVGAKTHPYQRPTMLILSRTVFVILSVLTHCTTGQLGFDTLEEVGVISTATRSLKITGPATKVNLVIKLVPNVGSSRECFKPAMDQYLTLIRNVVDPLSDALLVTQNRFTFSEVSRSGTAVAKPRFFGVAVGLAALGVATAATVVGGLALHNSKVNARNIAALSASIVESNAAIQSLIDAQGRTVVAIQGVQDHINTAVIPAIESLGCDVARNSLGITLTQYYSQLTFVFGPNLGNPIEQPVTVQAIAHLFGGDFAGIMRQFGYSSGDVLELLATGSIKGSIIDVNRADNMLILEISFPQFIGVDNTALVSFETITFNSEGSEWQTEVPKMVAVRDTLLSGVDTTGCILTQESAICPQDPTYAISDDLVRCLKGEVVRCTRIRILSTFAQRFAINRGYVIANCVSASCLCGDPGTPVVQHTRQTLTSMGLQDCAMVTVDGTQILPPQATRNISTTFGNVTIGPPITIDPIDVSSGLASIKKDLLSAQESLDKANAILAGINPSVINNGSMIGAIVMSVVAMITIVIAIIVVAKLWRDTHKLKRFQKWMMSKSVSSLGPMSN